MAQGGRSGIELVGVWHWLAIPKLKFHAASVRFGDMQGRGAVPEPRSLQFVPSPRLKGDWWRPRALLGFPLRADVSQILSKPGVWPGEIKTNHHQGEWALRKII